MQATAEELQLAFDACADETGRPCKCREERKSGFRGPEVCVSVLAKIKGNWPSMPAEWLALMTGRPSPRKATRC
jgi:hypothetical protein